MNLRMLRGLAGATSLALLGTALLSSGALAANQRSVYFGSPPTETEDFGGGYNNDGSLLFGELVNGDRVTAGKKAATTLLVRNDGGQALNHVKIAGGTVADGKPYNPLFPRPDVDGVTGPDPSLPTGASYAKVIPLSGSTCSSDSGPSFECNIGSLAPGVSASFLIVVNVPTVADEHSYWVTGSWNEGWSSTGTNADYNFAVGTLNVEANSCAGGTASYFLGTEEVALDDGSTDQCQAQSASVASGDVIGGNGGFATVGIDSASVTCPAGYKCFGKPVSVSILDGDPVPGGVEWTIRWFGTKTMKGVIHYGEDYPAVATDFTPITFNKAGKCSTTKLTDCWVSLTTSAGNSKPSWIEAVFITESNGKGGGFY